MRTPPLILIVEDNPESLDILRARLTAHNYEVITAPDGEAGLTMAREQQPDLILLDIMMPKMDGIEVCRRIKEDPSLPFMPIIMVTAKADSKDVVAGLEAGGDEYLTKPVDHMPRWLPGSSQCSGSRHYMTRSLSSRLNLKFNSRLQPRFNLSFGQEFQS
jgi:CheY-like chemotaxis protein